MNLRATQATPTTGTITSSLNDSWPRFLDLLDTDPDRAWEEFHAFAWKLTRLRQPPAVLSLAVEEREDLLADIVQDFQENGFRLLRRYQDRGRPFAAWFWLVLKRRALDRLKTMKMRDHEAISEEFQGGGPSPTDETGSRSALEVVRALIRQLSPRCRVLLLATAEGYRPKDLLELGSLPYTDNKKLADHLKNCRRSLIKALARQGYAVDDLLG